MVRVFDNGGRTCDRYTVIIGDSYYGMSENPFHPQGFNQYCGETSSIQAWIDDPDKEDVELDTIPDCLIKAIQDRIGG